MDERTNDLKAKLENLSIEFKQNLPSKIDQINKIWLSLRNGGWDLDQLNELRSQVHKIAGSGGIFGFSDVSDVALKIESSLDEAIPLKRPMTKEGMDIMDRYLEELISTIDRNDM